MTLYTFNILITIIMNDKKKVMVVFGTRPDAIKMAPLILEMRKNKEFEIIVCSTGQHKEMLQQVLDVFWIIPDINLSIMEDNQTITTITKNILTKLEQYFKINKPDLVLVHWDTSSGFSAALSAFYAQIAVGHVEAGLRTYNKYSPFPEEMNRKLIAAIADIHFCPTQWNYEALLQEGLNETDIYITWNTWIDAMKYTIKDNYIFKEWILNSLDYSIKTIIVTAHRRENVWQPLDNICKAILRIAQKDHDLQVVFPVHLNPKVQDIVYRILWNQDNIYLLNPLDVEDLHNLMSRSYLIATDSGWIQEEWPYLKKPVLVLRSETERPEAVDAGTVKLIGTDENIIYNNIVSLLEDSELYSSYQKATNPYGDWNSSVKIVQIIKNHFWIE